MSAVPFTCVLVANRGEIARRIIRTLRRLGIRSVAVYSDADAGAPHVREADVAVRIGPPSPAESYLRIEAVVAAAVQTGADAVHPGYGFLSENVDFARACEAAGIVFIGPGDRALDIMGDKIRAKEHVTRHGVPTVPGFSAAGMTDAEIAESAAAAGYPLLVKPSSGGGGKGMEVVRSAHELPEALATARRIARAAFGDDTLLLERLIERPRHIEVQILADAHGSIVHLGERECTLQRRHQKVVEEAPSPVVDAATRSRIGAAACAAAASVDYRGAGTVEFLVAGDRPDDFFFIEMNTRLQVEHAVTELVTGIDLVEQQLRIAAGEKLAFAQRDVRMTGHAIEARVYAESPSRGFLPATGDVLIWEPATGARTDAAIETGSLITADYDPMVAKVIGFGSDRAEALRALDTALAETVLLGVDSNLAFLRTLLADPAVMRGDIDTSLIDRLPPVVEAPPSADIVKVAASVVERARRRTHADSVWGNAPGWRLGADAMTPAQSFETEGGDIVSSLAEVREAEDREREGVRVRTATEPGGIIWVHAAGETHRLRPITRRDAVYRRLSRADAASSGSSPELRAAMPGTVVALHVEDGAVVSAGARIVTIEAMKMEHPATAPHDGVVRLDVAIGDAVRRDDVIAHVTANAAGEESHGPR